MIWNELTQFNDKNKLRLGTNNVKLEELSNSSNSFSIVKAS